MVLYNMFVAGVRVVEFGTYGFADVQIEEERISTIERGNWILLERMSEIMQTTSGVDNENN